MTQPLLSICIPTYNRVKHLPKLLESIDAQNAPEHLYEVHVRDNASTDDSAAHFHRIARGRPNWRWFQNEVNRGGLANVRECTLQATGHFTWIVGSDDALEPGALNTLFEILTRAKQQNMTALFLQDRLPPKYAVAKPFDPPLAWLRYVSINVPAFITAVIWDTPHWRAYPYEQYPKNLSMPQLEAFVLASLNNSVWGFNKRLVKIEEAEVTSKPNYWYARRYPYDNVFEYPLLYQQILKSPRVDFRSRIMIWLRRFSNVRQMYRKLILMRYQEQYYHTRAKDLKKGSGSMYTWPLIYLMAKALLEWPIGERIANRRCKGAEKLPARDPNVPDVF